MQYLTRFNSLVQYTKWLSSNKDKDNVTYIKESDSIVIHKKEYVEPIEEHIYLFGDILLYDEQNDQLIKCTVDEWEDNYEVDDNYIPQALCVISENILPDNYARFISLDGVSANGGHYDNYDNLQTDVHYLRWSGVFSNNVYSSTLYEDTSLTNRNNLKPIIDVEDDSILDENGGNYGFIPYENNNYSNNSYTNDNLVYSDEALTSNNPCFPPLYLSDWTLNTGLFSQNTSANSLLQDIDGKANTSVLTTLNTGNNLYPAAYACWMYETEGIEQGEWYLPSITELMLCMTRFDSINAILNRLGVLPLHSSNYYWSSTGYSDYYAYGFYTNNGYFYYYDKYNDILVRAFCRL